MLPYLTEIEGSLVERVRLVVELAAEDPFTIGFFESLPIVQNRKRPNSIQQPFCSMPKA